MIFEEEGAAARIEHVVGADRVLDDVHHRPLPRRRGPQEMAFCRMEPVQVAGTAGVEELLVVVKIEAIEVGALAAFDLFDAQHLTLLHLQGLAGAGLDGELVDEFPGHGRHTQDYWGMCAMASTSRRESGVGNSSKTRTTVLAGGSLPKKLVRMRL